MSLVPSSPADRKKLKNMLVEMTNSLQRQDDEKEAMKDIVAACADDFDIPKKVVSKLARTMFKRNYASLQAENEDFEILYETLVEGKSTDDE